MPQDLFPPPKQQELDVALFACLSVGCSSTNSSTSCPASLCPVRGTYMFENHELLFNIAVLHMLGAVVLDCHVEGDDVLIVVALLAQLPSRVAQLRVHVFNAQVGELLPVVDAHVGRFCCRF